MICRPFLATLIACLLFLANTAVGASVASATSVAATSSSCDVQVVSIEFEREYRATEDEINLRSGPGLDCRVVTQIDLGATVRVVGESVVADGLDWVPVEVGDRNGFLYLGNVEPVDPSDRFATEVCSPIVTDPIGASLAVGTDQLNFRSGPSTLCDVIDQLAYGEEVVVAGESIDRGGREWTPVLVGSTQGFVATAGLIDPASIASPTIVPVLMYHDIGYPADRYRVSPDSLESQLAWLRSNGFTSITPSDLIGWLNGEQRLPPRPVIISVDDGWASTRLFTELVSAYGFQGTYMLPNYTSLTNDEIRELAVSGEVCGHSVSHQFLAELSWDLQYYEIAENRAWLSAVIGEPVRCFSYPFGSFNDATKQILRDVGFEIGFHAWWGPAPLDGSLDRWAVQRIEINGTYSLETFVSVIGY